jgi:hypothetical protein
MKSKGARAWGMTHSINKNPVTTLGTFCMTISDASLSHEGKHKYPHDQNPVLELAVLVQTAVTHTPHSGWLK